MVKMLGAVRRSERKEWAREVFRGGENTLFPSFTPDYSALDEEAIRLDVRNCIAHGFFAMFCPGIGLTADEKRRFMQVAVDEAGDEIAVSMGVGGSTVGEVVAALAEAEALGCSHVMLSLPSSLRSHEEALAYGIRAAESTNLGIVLYATSGRRFRHLDPSNVPFDVFAAMSEQTNVVAMKVSQTVGPVTAYQCCERLGDKILLGPVNLELAPFMAKLCRIQYTGMWQVDSHQSPGKPYVVQYMKLLEEGRLDEAAGLFYQMQPLAQLFWDLQAPLLKDGGHPWAHLKYYQWCTGGNGGLLRPGSHGHEYPPIDQAGRDLIRRTYAECGIATPENDEEFRAGKAAYARGVRAADLAANATYV